MKLFKKASDPVSSYTHFLAACLSLIGLIIMIFLSIKKDFTLIDVLGMIIFCVSMICLYSSSSIYHYFSNNVKLSQKLRKLDHSMIYILIVGTYTPIVLKCMPMPHSLYFLGIIWSIALIGVLLKIIWINAPRLLSTVIYLLLGWSIIFDWRSFACLPMNVLLLIAIGGIIYSMGALIYIFKKPNINEEWGFHELFHLFCIGGSLCHYIAILILFLG